MRFIQMVLVLGALALIPSAMALENTAVEFTAEQPSEIEVAGPTERTTVEGRELTADSGGESTEPRATGGIKVDDLDVDARGPSCKVGLDLTMADDASRRCDTGAVETNAGLDLVTVDLDVRLPSDSNGGDADATTLTAANAALADGPASAAVLLAAAAAGASMGLLYGIWRVLKWTGLAALFPLYSHISDDEILDDPNRASIYRLIQAEVGISTKDIADRLDLAWGTVTHHLTKLEKRRFVVSKKYGKYRRYFANGSGGTELKDEVAVLRLDRTGDIAALIRERPGMTQKEVSDHLGVSSSTILWHVKRLEEVSLVKKVRDGKQVRYFPLEGLQGTTLISPAQSAA